MEFDFRDVSESSYTSSPRISEKKTNGSVVEKEEKYENEKEKEPTSPLHIGVTTLQKIFRTLTPGGVWREQESIAYPKIAHETSSESKERPASEPRSLVTSKNQITEIAKFDARTNGQPEKLIDDHNSYRRESKEEQRRGSNQDYHNEHSRPDKRNDKSHYRVDLNTYIDGFGDASFGTPV